MATRRRKPQNKDLSDLKARLGLDKSLDKRPSALAEPEPAAPAPAHVNMGQPAPGAAPPGQAPGYPPAGHPGAPAPGRPPFAGPPPHARRPPAAKKPKPKPKAPEWSPPAIDPNAATDVPIKTPRSLGQLLAVLAGVTVLTLFSIGIGFFFGNGAQQRALYNAKSDDAKRIMKLVEPCMKEVNSLLAAAEKHDGASPDAEVLEKLSKVDFVLEPEAIAQGKLLLGPEITPLLMRFSADTQYVAGLMKRHQTMSTRVDKKELEDLSKADDARKAKGFAVAFDTKRFTSNLDAKKQQPPLEGRLFVLDTFDTIDKDGEKLVKLRSPSNGQEYERSLRQIVLLDAKQMLASSGPNALRRYERRHKEITAKLKEISQYADPLMTKLGELADRPPAPLLSVR